MSAPTPEVFLGFDMGGTKILGMLVDSDGHPLAEQKVPTPGGGLDSVVESMAAVGDDLLREAGGDEPLRPRAVGLGAPGLVDRGGVFRYGANLPAVIDGGFGVALSEVFDAPAVVDNDATCAAWAEHIRGAARGADHAVVITLGTGIGAGIISGGALVRGANGFAGEPGHMILDPDGPLCPCGRRGCWERYASGNGLGRLAREAAAGGGAPRLVDLAGSIDAIRGEHVFEAARAGDPAALTVIDEFAGWFALGVSNLVNILDSEIVVIGGGVVEGGDLILQPIRDAFRTLVYGVEHRPEVEISIAELGPRAGAWGAALLAVGSAASAG